MRYLWILLPFFLAGCGSHSKRIAKWTGCQGTFQEKLISESVGMRTTEVSCDGKVMICKYSTAGFGQCRPKDKAYEGSWTKKSEP